MLAIHWGINFFKPYLYGRKFIVVTDHRPLVSLFTHKNPSSKLTRVRMDLSDYDFEIIYKKGTMNTNADALSRIKIDSDILKSMLPRSNENKENDCDSKERIMTITRGMTAKAVNNKNKLTENDISQQRTDHLHIWECTSLSDVRNIKKLKFILASYKRPKIEINKNEIIVRCSDNLAKLVSTLEKLTSEMKSMQIDELALSEEDMLFGTLRIDEFKNMYNGLQPTLNKRYSPLKILIYKPPKKITNMEEKLAIIDEFHNSPHGGHIGIRKTVTKLKQRYVWKHMRQMVKRFINACELCAKNKQTRHIKEKMIVTNTPSTSFETIQIDTVGPLRISNGYRYILTMQCELTKYVVAHPIESKDAKTIAKTLVQEFILRYGHFKVLKSDNGTEFKNELMQNICEMLKIKPIHSAPYHHQSLGSLERNHRVLNEFLLNFTEDHEWDIWIPYYAFAYNTTPHIDTNFTPYELIFGKLPYLPNDIINNKKIVYNTENYANELKLRLKHAIEKTRKIINNVKNKRKIDYDKYTNISNLKIGDLVLVRLESRKKSQSPYHGPYRIIETDDVNSIIEIKGEHKKLHNNSLKKYNAN